jgi:uncharacterized protein (TIGR02246 family)
MTDEHHIAAVLDAYRAAALAKDVGAFTSLYAADVRVFDAWATYSYEGLAAWRPVVQQWLGRLSDERVEVTAQDVQISCSTDRAVLSAFLTYAALSPAGDRLRAMQNRLTWILARKDDAWKIVHEHTSVPISEDLKAILERP